MTFLPLLLVLFAASGCAALIYEIVWFQMLQLIVGSTALSLNLLLATFMGGMFLGSLLLPRLRWRRHPLLTFAFLEAGIALCGLAALTSMPLAQRFPLAGVLGLLPPTLLMGASLPACARWVETTPRGVAWLGFLYGGNIAGAVMGCLLAGFYLLRVHDMTTATLVAASPRGSICLAYST